MSCPCESYIRLVINTCAITLVLDEVIADATEVWTALIEFNGLLKCSVNLAVTAGQPVELPNILNEDYTHEMRIFRADNSLVGCYWIGGQDISQTTPCGFFVTEDGNSFVTELGYSLIIG